MARPNHSSRPLLVLAGVIVAYVAILAIIYFSFSHGTRSAMRSRSGMQPPIENDDVDSTTSEDYAELEREAIAGSHLGSDSDSDSGSDSDSDSTSTSDSAAQARASPPRALPPVPLVRASSADFRAGPTKRTVRPEFPQRMTMTPDAPYERVTYDDVAERVRPSVLRSGGQRESSVSKLADSIERAMSAPPIRHQRSFRERVELDKILHGAADEQERQQGGRADREFQPSSIEIEEASHRVPIDKVQHAMMLSENSPMHVVYPTEDATYGQEAYEASHDYRNDGPKSLARMSPEDRIMSAHIQKLV